jgi:cell division protein FtsA
VWHDNAIRFVRGIPFGTGDIDNDIHQQGILEKHVDGLKTTFGVAMAGLVTSDKLIAISGRSPREKQEISQRNLATIIEHRLREIFGFVVDEIGDSGYAGKLKGGIVLTGGGSRMSGIDKLIREVTGMDVRLALPDVHVADESLSLAQDPAYATVIGLLLKANSETTPALVASRVRPAHNLVSAAGAAEHSRGVAGVVHAGVDEFESDRDSAESDEKSGKPHRSKKERGGIKKWFEGFLSEPLDGDEDF